MPRRMDAALEALKWVDTPFRDKGRSIERGVDCVGLPICVGMTLNLPEAFEANKEQNYPRIPNGWRLREHLNRFMDPVSRDQAGPGDVLQIIWRRYPIHVAMMAPPRGGHPYIIHAYESVGKVVHHRLDSEWSGRIAAVYRYRGLD